MRPDLEEGGVLVVSVQDRDGEEGPAGEGRGALVPGLGGEEEGGLHGGRHGTVYDDDGDDDVSEDINAKASRVNFTKCTTCLGPFTP